MSKEVLLAIITRNNKAGRVIIEMDEPITAYNIKKIEERIEQAMGEEVCIFSWKRFEA